MKGGGGGGCEGCGEELMSERVRVLPICRTRLRLCSVQTSRSERYGVESKNCQLVQITVERNREEQCTAE